MMNQQFALNSNNEFIIVADEQDRNYWAARLGVSIETLKSAIRASKSNAFKNIENYLIEKRKLV